MNLRWLVTGVFLAIAFGGAAVAQEILEYKDIFELEYASDVQISPDGSQIVYVRVSQDIMSDQAHRNIWIINADGTDHRAIASGAGNFTSPRLSPDGSRLIYISSEDGSSQINLRWMDTGQTAQLTNLTSAPANLTWSPDGRQIGLTMFVAAEGPSPAALPAPPEGAEWAPPMKVIDRLIYRANGRGYLAPGNTHIFVLPVEGGTPRQVSSGDFNYNGNFAWGLDSQSLFVSVNRDQDWQYQPRESELYRLTLDDGSLARLTKRNGPDTSPRLSPDGTMLAYTGFDDAFSGSINSRLYVKNLTTGEVSNLTEFLDRSVSNPRWNADGSGLYFQFTNHGVTQVGLVGLKGDYGVVASGLGGSSLGRPYASGGYSVSGNDVVAYVGTNPARPADIFVTSGADASQVTGLNEDALGHLELAEVREIWTESSLDSRPIQSWVALPPGFDSSKKYPLILEIHGGPYAAYGPGFAAEIQLYAAAGYVVVYSNPRGSTSYGAEFAQLIDNNYPSQDYDDLMSAVDAVIAEGFIDEDNLFVTGGSGGGVLTAWIVGKTDRFRAAVVAKPVINWASFVLTADNSWYYATYWFEKMPWEDLEAYWKRSPLSLVGNVVTPTMVMTGEDDFRTPIAETEQYYQALKFRKIETRMVRIPGANHGIAARPSNLIGKVANILAWFEKYRTGSD